MTPEGVTRILAIDPGVTTGIAALVDGEIAQVNECSSPFDMLRNAIRITNPEVVVCEQGPSFERHHRVVLEQVERIVQEEAENIVWVKPSQWKGTPPSQGPAIEGSQHMKDAAALARWYYNTQGSNSAQDETADAT